MQGNADAAYGEVDNVGVDGGTACTHCMYDGTQGKLGLMARLQVLYSGARAGSLRKRWFSKFCGEAHNARWPHGASVVCRGFSQHMTHDCSS